MTYVILVYENWNDYADKKKVVGVCSTEEGAKRAVERLEERKGNLFAYADYQEVRNLD